MLTMPSQTERRAAAFAVRALAGAERNDLGGAIRALRDGGQARAAALLGKAFAVTLGDAATLAEAGIAETAFFQSMSSDSAFFALLGDQLLRRVPLRTQLGISTLSLSAASRDEGAAIRTGGLTLSRPTLPVRNVGSIIVMTRELASAASPAALSLIDAELRAAVGVEADAEFIDAIIDSATTLLDATGDPLVDLAAMLGAINTAGRARLAWIAHPGVLAAAASAPDHMGGRIFPETAPAGPTELLMLPAYPSSALPEGRLVLLRCDRIAAAAEDLTIDPADQATLEVTTPPTGSAIAPTATELVSLFQTASTAIRIAFSLGAATTGDDAVAVLDGAFNTTS